MISAEKVYQALKQQENFISAVELAMILETSVSDVRQRLNELDNRVTRNEKDEYRVAENLVQKLELSPLSKTEIEERNELENTVQQAFFVAGQALKILRDKRLYRETHSTFEAYIRDRFDFTKRKAYYLIDAYQVTNNLKSEPMVHFLPTSERQCRAIAKLPPEQQKEIWLTSIERAGGKIPSGKIVKEVVNQIKGISKMKEKPITEKIVRTPGMETEYLICFSRETYEMLQDYRQKNGIATNEGAVRRLLDAENQQS